MNSNFSWVPFYRELAEKVLKFEDRQDELLALISEVDRKAGSNHSPIDTIGQKSNSWSITEGIDPFTFFVWGGGEIKRLKRFCRLCKKKFDLHAQPPEEFDGVAEWNYRFLSRQIGRKPNELELLWKIAKQAYEGPNRISAEVFDLCLCLPQMDMVQLTTGLCWFNPNEYLPASHEALARLSGRLAVNLPVKDWISYAEFLFRMRTTYDKSFPELLNEIQAEEYDSSDLSVSQALAQNTTMQTMNKIPLNRILYGPPGTGKTFCSISKAVELIDGAEPTKRVECQKRFYELHLSGQIEFVTFHQSFSYEEFVEGLRPVITDKVGEVRYEIREGVLRRITRNAAQKMSESNDWSFDFAWKLVRDYVAQNPGITIDGRSAKSKFQLTLGADRIWGCNILSASTNNNFRCLENVARKAWDGAKSKADITAYDVQRYEPKVGAEGAMHAVILNKMRDLVTEANKVSNFVLIVDEINRGNISKIFGELITLLEEDKRLGEPNELRVTLPTSGEAFALPPNLYILGTMNTADKSLAQLDVALRRRFDFEELAPRPDLCDKLDGLPDILKALNERLEWALDREHRLGHAYFMDVDSAEMFNERFRSKVVPLLIECFPHDFATLRAVLGESNKADGFLYKFEAPEGMSGKTKYRWWFEMEGKNGFSAFEQLKDNFGIS